MSPTRCTACGTVPSATSPVHSWSMGVRAGTRSWTCPACARAELVGIECGVPAQRAPLTGQASSSTSSIST